MPQAVALRNKDMGLWQEWTWATYWEHIELAGHALLALGVAPGDRVAIHSENRPEWLIADMGALAVRAASVGIYPTSPAAEVGYLLGDSGARILVAEDQEQVDKALSVLDECPDLERIVYLEPRGIRHRYDHEKLMSWQAFLDLGREHRDSHPDAVAEVLAGQRPDDLATLIYTSGTTGPPKGAMLSVANVEFAIQVLVEDGAFTDPPPGPRDLSLSYLPLSHVAERIFTTWFNAAAGTQVNFAESIETVPQNLREVQPTILFGVPRIWEKLLAGIEIRLSGATWLKRKVAAFWLGVADRIGSRLVANGGSHTAGTRVRLRARLRGVLPRAEGPARAAQGPVRRLGCGADRARGAAVLHGHRGAHARGLRHDREHRGRHREPAGPGQARDGGRGAPRHRAPDRPGHRGDPQPAPRRVRGLLAQGRGHPPGGDRGRLAAHRGRRRVGGRHPPADHGPDEGHHHHRRRQEHLAVADRERAQGVAVRPGSHRDRRRPEVPHGADRDRARHRRGVGTASPARLQHLPRPQQKPEVLELVAGVVKDVNEQARPASSRSRSSGSCPRSSTTRTAS